MNIPVNCDVCKKIFLLKDLSESDVSVNGEVVKITFFCCPNCKKIFVISIKDDKCIGIQNELNKIKSKYNKILNGVTKDPYFLEVLLRTIQNKKDRLANRIEKLKNKYNGTFTFAMSENNSKDFIIYLPYNRMEENKNG